MKSYIKYSKVVVVWIALLFISCSDLPMAKHIDYDAEWILVVESLSDPEHTITIKNSEATSSVERRGNTLLYKSVGDKNIDIKISYKADKESKGALRISTSITNNEEGWVVTSFEGPFLKDIKAEGDDAFLLPIGTGFRMPIKALTSATEGDKTALQYWKWIEEKGQYEIFIGYPSEKCTMQWGVIQGKGNNLYFASHDELFSFKHLRATYEPTTKRAYISFCNQFTIFPTQTVEVAPLIIKQEEGEWYRCADIYRKWFLAHRNIIDKPEWIKNCSGWLLAILKQQNDEVIIPYNKVGNLLADAAEERGIDAIGLFGRGIGGHDRFYPDYSPDPKMGGKEALIKGIAEAKAKGKRVILYTNGQLLDMHETPQFWPDTGRVISVRRADGSIASLSYHKYHDAPGREFGLACHSCNTWREIMLRLAKDAKDLGADGILYDQLAVLKPMYCYHPDHGHSVPAIVYESDRLENMRYIQQEMAKIDPDFVVMTEGLADYELNVADIFHAYCPGAIIPTKEVFMQRFDDEGSMQHFTEMFHYTFPENIITIRVDCPTNTRFMLNYNLSFGFRNEMEVRYAADRKYIESGVVPKIEEYGNVKFKPSIDLIKEAGDMASSIEYYRQALTFQQEHSDLIMHGRYIAGNGITLDASSPYVMANGWLSQDGEQLGILVWNITEKQQSYSIKYNGYEAVEIYSPDKRVELGDNIAPQSLHLIIFKK